MKKYAIFVVAALLLSVLFAFAAVADEGDVCYYVDYNSGYDRNSGLAPTEALKTVNRAYLNAKSKNDVSKVVIVIMSECPASASITETEHPDVKFVVTSHDGKTDYRKVGAKLVFGDTLRYYLKGDTTFENVSFEYSTSINFVASHNPITFDEGISFKCVGGKDKGIYVVGGWQSPMADVDTTLDSHITINSGDFAAVIGGARQNGKNCPTRTFTGTHYINIGGGNIENLICGTFEDHNSGCVELNVTGGHIETLCASGDEMVTWKLIDSNSGRHMNGTARITLSGGKIDAFKCIGIIGGADVELCGADVGKIYAGYPSGKLEYLRTKSGGKMTLKYDPKIYSEKQIAEYTGFDIVEGADAATKEVVDTFVPVDGVVFVADGGSGTGESPMKAAGSLEYAYSKLSKTGGTIVICGKCENRTSEVYASNGKIILTSVYGGVDYAKENGAELILFKNFTCGGETVIKDITLRATDMYLGIVANGNRLHIGQNVTCIPDAFRGKYPCLVAGKASSASNISTDMTVDSGTWDRIRGGNSDSGRKCDVNITVNGGRFYEFTLASKNAHSGDVRAVINGGEFLCYLALSTFETSATYSGNVNVDINGGAFYGDIAVSRDDKGSVNGSFTLNINGGDFRRIGEISGTKELAGNMTSTLNVASYIDIEAEIDGEMSFTNAIRQNGADPWLFYHDGYYYYTASDARTLSLARARNIGDLKYAIPQVIYAPKSGHPWSMHQWSPEIHYYTDEQVGEGNGGWYCYIAPCSEEQYREGEQDHRMYVIKCLDGDNLLGRWGNPVTGEVNVPERVAAPDIPDWDTIWAGGQSSIVINGKPYTLFIGMSKERVENENHTFSPYQYICIAPMTNPWTIKGQPTMICKPEYDWEKVGSETGAAQVVEGATAVYGVDGSVYIIYSGSGYWTTEYQLGQLKYTGGDPMDARNWQKKPTSIFRQNNVLTGSGHASYVKDTFGQGWICYHAYVGDPNSQVNNDHLDYGGGRLAFVEPYYADKNGVVIGDGSKKPAPLDMVYVTKVNQLPLAKRIYNFDSINSVITLRDVLSAIKDQVSLDKVKEMMNSL